MSMAPLARRAEVWGGREIIVDRRARAAVAVVAFAAATAFGAQVAVPLTQVPVTLQLLFVVLSGVVLGPRLGAASMALYLAVGAAGAPIFSMGGSGLPWLMGPTGGYLIAMPAAAFAAGLVAGARREPLRVLLGLTAGVATVYVGGVAQLLLLTGQDVRAVIALGVTPFLFGDALKVGVAWVLSRLIRGTSLDRF